jgi:hypothetical protein
MREWWGPLCTRPTHLVGFFLVLAHWNNSPQIDMSIQLLKIWPQAVLFWTVNLQAFYDLKIKSFWFFCLPRPTDPPNNCISGVMVSVLASSVVDHGFESPFGSKDINKYNKHEIYIDRITVVLKVETDIITGNTASLLHMNSNQIIHKHVHVDYNPLKGMLVHISSLKLSRPNSLSHPNQLLSCWVYYIKNIWYNIIPPL